MCNKSLKTGKLNNSTRRSSNEERRRGLSAKTSLDERDDEKLLIVHDIFDDVIFHSSMYLTG